MARPFDTDARAPEVPMLPFDPRDFDRSALRMTRSQFAAFLGITRQSVFEMVKTGRITVEPDGLVNPRRAISQLLRTSDLGKLRVRILEPWAKQLEAQRARIRELETRLAAEVEESDFAEAAFDGLDQILDALVARIGEADRDGLRITGAAVAAWEHAARQLGGDAGPLADFEPAGDPAEDLLPGAVHEPIPALEINAKGSGLDDEKSATEGNDDA